MRSESTASRPYGRPARSRRTVATGSFSVLTRRAPGLARAVTPWALAGAHDGRRQAGQRNPRHDHLRGKSLQWHGRRQIGIDDDGVIGVNLMQQINATSVELGLVIPSSSVLVGTSNVRFRGDVHLRDYVGQGPRTRLHGNNRTNQARYYPRLNIGQGVATLIRRGHRNNRRTVVRHRVV